MVSRILAIAIGGACGTLARYFLGGWAAQWWGPSFPWATWLINGSGCFLFGLIWTLADERFLVSPQWRIILLTGFMGAYTTYSTYMFEVGRLVQGRQWWYAAADFLGQNLLGFALARAL
jgi:fluoride exporter